MSVCLLCYDNRSLLPGKVILFLANQNISRPKTTAAATPTIPIPNAVPLTGFAAGIDSGRTHSVFSFDVELAPNPLKKSRMTDVSEPPLTPSISWVFNSRILFPYAVITEAIGSKVFSTIVLNQPAVVSQPFIAP